MLLLKTLVIGFAILLIAAAIILIVFGLRRMGGEAFGTAGLAVPKGCEIGQTVAEGDRLILTLTGLGEDCRRVLIADMKSGKLVGQFELKTP